ncbi:MAG: hypothetical protein HPY78_05415 [Brevinematales bacterium]|nr:hypothetical protein [Brevinematales bacterium]
MSLNSKKVLFRDRGSFFHEGIEPDRIDQKGKQKEVQIEEIRKEKEKYQRILTTIAEHTKKDYFLWEVDFAEVFAERRGFDIVIGNPPYVRQELIAPPLANQGDYSDERWGELKSQYKKKLIASVKNIWRTVQKIDKKSDLYVYFYYHGLSLLRPGGVFCFINSNSWLDVGYGAGLQEFLLQNMRPLFIIDNLKKRSFKQAKVNTVIVFIQRPEEKLEDYTVKFVAFKKPFEEVHNAEVIKKIEKTTTPLFDDEDCRIFPKTRKELLLEGVEIEEEQEMNPWNLSPESLPYIGNKWGGKYLRAPDIYWRIIEKNKNRLVPLRAFCEYQYGLKPGNVDFFYLSEKTIKEYGIPINYTYPILTSTQDIKKFFIIAADCAKMFYCVEPIDKIKNKGVYNYIKDGEKKKIHQIVSVKNHRPFWYSIHPNDPDVILLQFFDQRFWTLLCKDNIACSNNFYYGKLTIDINIGITLLNSIFYFLQVEMFGRVNMAEGVLTIYGEDFRFILLPKPEVLNKQMCENVLTTLFTREIQSIFTELGFDPNKPIREQEPNPLPDRKALDDIVFDALGLSEEERKEVYWAVAELVKNRLEKARGV